jgi:hypothetical protein
MERQKLKSEELIFRHPLVGLSRTTTKRVHINQSELKNDVLTVVSNTGITVVV